MILRKLLRTGEKASRWLPVVIMEIPGDRIMEITLVREPRALTVKIEIEHEEGIHYETFFHDPDAGSFVPEKGEITELSAWGVSLEDTNWVFDSETFQNMKDAVKDMTEVVNELESEQL